MRTLLRGAAFLFLALLGNVVPAGAELIRGEVAAVDTNNNSLRVVRNNPLTGRKEEMSVTVDPSTRFKDIVYLGAIENGTEILIDGWVDAVNKNIKARTIELAPPETEGPDRVVS
jgi:hypothetical protein